MISYLSGKLISKKPTEAIVDVQGVGYQVQIPTTTFERLPKPGEQVLLHTHHYVREDAELLFGFADRGQRSIFQIMLGVTGIGPKLALAALSAFDPADFREHVIRADVGVLTGIPGVGRKTAERLIVELRDKFSQPGMIPLEGGVLGEAGSLRADALAALEALGLSRSSAERSLSRVLKGNPDLKNVEELIRRALQGGS